MQTETFENCELPVAKELLWTKQKAVSITMIGNCARLKRRSGR